MATTSKKRQTDFDRIAVEMDMVVRLVGINIERARQGLEPWTLDDVMPREIPIRRPV